jgi:hypothetical protein
MSSASPAWDSADLVRRLSGALDIAEQAIVRLAPGGYSDDIDPALNLRPEKVISETGVLLLAASTVHDQRALQPRLDHLARLLTPHARSARMRMGICFEPALALDYAQAHGCLRKMGHADSSFDALVDTAKRSQAFSVRERTPHRALEQHWIAELCGVEGPLMGPSRYALASMSALGRPLDLLGGSREDLYAFTHALMYATDLLSPRTRGPRCRADVLHDAEAALVRCLDDEDYDLAGELLLTWPLTGTAWSATAAFAFQTLAFVEDEVGFLPSAGTKLKHLNRLAGTQRSDCLLASAYHTIYVMGLLCAASLAPNRVPPMRPFGRMSAPHVVDDMHAGLSTAARSPHWLLAYGKLAKSERRVLGSFLYAVALVRAVRARDLHAVHELLAGAAAAKLANGPLWSQAAELLERAAAHTQAAPLEHAMQRSASVPASPLLSGTLV